MPKSVPIFLNRDNYEKQIWLHGQYVLHKSSQVCACIGADGRPDPNCEICEGFGRTYYDQTQYKIVRDLLRVEGSVGHANLGYAAAGKIVSVDKVYDADLSVVCFHGKQIMFNKIIDKSHDVYVDYTFDTKVSAPSVDGIYRGNGIIEIENFGFQSLRGLFVQYEILDAKNIQNITQPPDTKLDFIDAYKNFVVIDEHQTTAVAGDIMRMDIDYISPMLMLVVGITEKMRYENSYMLPESEASLTVPNHIEVAEGDLFTMVMTEQPFSLVKQFHRPVDALDHYDISRIIKVMDRLGNAYQEGVDYVQTSRDSIKWLDSSMLTGSYSIKYLYRVMFRALSNLPSLRYGENQPFPRKVMLKQYSRLHAEPVHNI